MKYIANLRQAVSEGEIIYVEYTGEEFLRYMKPDGEYGYSYIGNRGQLSDWKDQEGVAVEEDSEFPDSLGGFSLSTLYVQPNKDVHTPLDECEEWENDWEIIDEWSFRYKLA